MMGGGDVFLGSMLWPILYNLTNFSKKFTLLSPATQIHLHGKITPFLENLMASIEERAQKLLGSGLLPSVVATTLGVTPSAISQLLAQDQFAEEVAKARYENLAAHTERDNKYDSLEDQILDRLQQSLSMIFDPMKLVRILQVVNTAKRRGSGVQELPATQQTVVQLVMPTQIINQFTRNGNNQIVKAGDQDLVTMQSMNLPRLLEAAQNVQTSNSG